MENFTTYIPPKTVAQPGIGTKEFESKKAAEEFEAMFIAEMLKPMMESEEINPLFGGGEAEKIYRSMMVEEYGKGIAKAGGIGISADIQKEIMKLHEVK